MSIAAEQTGLIYKLEPVAFKGGIESIRVRWIENVEVTTTSDDLLKGQAATARDRAKTFIQGHYCPVNGS
jgi:hypothetical protein